MSRELTNHVLILDGREFAIQAVIGQGASCVVYRAECPDKTEHLLKEYNPRHIAMYREFTGELCLESEEDREEFEAGLVRFREGHMKQRELRLDSDLKNSTSNVQGIYKANGTEYIDMTCFSGKTYDQVREKSVYDLLRRMKALAQVIGNYHKAGLLHLDIKPENIFTLPETCEMVMLFDFDSVVSRESAAAGGARSYTLSWAAPEQINPLKRNAICEATDIFAVGEMIFYQLMGKTRHSTTEERLSFAEYNFDHTLPILENVNPKVFLLLEELLHKTICVSVQQRYKSTSELIVRLDEIIKIANPEAPFLAKKIPYAQTHFVGRIHEIEKIHELFAENGTVFISGVGGIGKSELVKKYAEKYHSSYDTITFVPFETDIATTISQAENLPYNVKQHSNENAKEYFARKVEELHKLCDMRTLIVLDNFDVTDDPNLKLLFTLGCKVLITTRADFSDVYAQLLVDAVEEPFEIFKEHYPKALSTEEKSNVGKIIEIICGHTLTVELLAKQMMAGRVRPSQMLERLQTAGIENAGKDKVRHINKNGALVSQSSYAHIQALFDLSKLNENEQYILMNLSLIPYTGIFTELFHDLCELEDYEVLNKLIIEGWIRHDGDNDYVSLHPLIAELLLKKVDTVEMFDSFLKGYVTHNRSRNNSEVKESSFYSENDRINRHLLLLVERYLFISKAFSSMLLDIGGEFYILHHLDLSERAYVQALRISDTLDVPNGYSATECMASLAFVRELKGAEAGDPSMIRRSIEVYRQAIKNHSMLDVNQYPNSYEEIATLYSYLGMAYYDLEDDVNAEIEYKKGIAIYENRSDLSSDDYVSLGILYNNLANVFTDYSIGLQYYIKALENHQNAGFASRHLAITYYHLADAYSEPNTDTFDLMLALEYAEKAMQFFLQEYSEDEYMIGETKYIKGKVYLQFHQRNYTHEAYSLLKDAEEVFLKFLSEDSRTVVKTRELLAIAKKASTN